MERVKKDHRISKAEAIAMTSRYRGNKEKLLPQALTKNNCLPICETYDRAAFDALLAQKDCASVRIYYGLNEQDQVHLVIVGVDANGKDILSNDEEGTESKSALSIEGVILDGGARCPEECPESSELNA
jgi:hypothetical protein